jgi:hypothetical protein
MYKIALIQNQSEMAHYGYADARALLSDLSYETTLFTAHNIEEMPVSLADSFDAVVLASNALNDKKIRETVQAGPVRDALQEFLLRGGGLLSFHQLGLAGLSDARFDFLPDALKPVQAVRRPADERSALGNLAISTAAVQHILLVYPNLIDSNVIQQNAVSFRSLPGLYWHYWDEIGLASWDTLMVDTNDQKSRPLLLASKQSEPYRIVMSALTLDWQRQRALLENLLTYVVEGRHSTALLSDDHHVTTGYSYLLETLRSRRFPFAEYRRNTNLSSLARYIESRVHTTLLLAPFVDLNDEPQFLQDAIKTEIDAGGLRLLKVEEAQSGVGRYSVVSRQRYATRIMQQVELRVQGELRLGYIDGSFWSTAESLQSLRAIPHRSKRDYGKLVVGVLTAINDHDRDGSYDEVFGATCAAYWIRATYLGVADRATRETERWIRSAINRYEDRERALAYTIFATCGVLTPDDKAQLEAIFTNLNFQRLTQADVVSYIRAALSVDALQCLPPLILSLNDQRNNEPWVDLATAAEAASLLMDCQRSLRNYPQLLSAAVSQAVNRLVFEVVIEMQGILERRASNMTGYPWDGKASTSLKCLEAWLKFDNGLETPVYDLVDELKSGAAAEIDLASGRTALNVLEELKTENEQLTVKLDAANNKFLALAHSRLRYRPLLAIAAVFMYLSVVFFTSGIVAGGKPFTKFVSDTFVTPWPFHLAFASLIAAGLAVPWAKWFPRDELGATQQ